MFKFFFPIIAICCFFVSCDNDNPVLTGKGSMELVFKAKFGTQPLVLGKDYDYFGIGTIHFDRTDILYSALKLLNATDSVLVKDVDYVSMMAHHTTVDLAESGLSVIYENIPTGNYNSLNFNIGIDSDLNKTKPADYQTSHPLGEGTRYWSGWNSYIFSKTEGIFNNGSSFPFTYHSGFDDALRSLHFVQPVVIRDDQKTKIELVIDYKKMFEVGNSSLDIPSNPQIHNKSDIMLAFMDRFQSAMSIQ